MHNYIWLNWAVMAASILGLLWLGWKSNVTIHQDNDDESGFLIAGRSLGPFVGASTIVATGYSGWGFMGSPGVAYEYGAVELLGNRGGRRNSDQLLSFGD